MQFDIITIFPNLFDSFLNESLIKKSLQKGVNKICVHDLRQWSKRKHKQVDDKPYGGGAGMVLMAEPIIRAIEQIQKNTKKQQLPRRQRSGSLLITSEKNKNFKLKVILLSPAGKQFNQKMAKDYSKLDQLILVCGRYQGVDARVEKFIDEKISIGPYIVSGGELPAMTIVESVSRLVPNYLGNPKSLTTETFSKNKKEFPQYTRPENLKIKNKNYKVPKVLLSGNHQEIEKWRKSNQ